MKKVNTYLTLSHLKQHIISKRKILKIIEIKHITPRKLNSLLEHLSLRNKYILQYLNSSKKLNQCRSGYKDTTELD